MTETELFKNDYCGEITTLTISEVNLYYLKLISPHLSTRNVVCLTKSEAICIAIAIFKKENIINVVELENLQKMLRKMGII
jgi:hypothetical protein